MNKKILLGMLAFACIILSCSCTSKKATNDVVVLNTKYGDIKIKLYDETPKHKNNFDSLANAGFYDGLLFHRIIEEFMIQGGDPDSKDAKPGKRLGNGGPGYQIDAEIVPGVYHKKGAVAAARMGDAQNPEKRSSGSQFYIVQGKVFTPEELTTIEEKKKSTLSRSNYSSLMREHRKELRRLQKEAKMDSVSMLMAELRERSLEGIDPALYKITDEQREIYTTIGGTPHLDGAYTVFGEVIEGLEFVDSIAAQPVDKNNRPMDDIQMKVIK